MKVVDNRMWQIYLVGIILRKLKGNFSFPVTGFVVILYIYDAGFSGGKLYEYNGYVFRQKI